MAKLIYPYGVFSATDIYNRSSNTGIKTNNSTNVSFTDITTGKIKNVLGESSNSVGNLYNSTNVNKWSNFGPYDFNIAGSYYLDEQDNLINTYVITSTVSAPYHMGDFAGYNHNAIEPNVSNYASSVNGQINQLMYFPLELEMGELDYNSLQIYKVRATLKEGSTTLGITTVDLSDSGNTYNGSSLFVPIQINWTVPSNWGTNKTLTIELDLLNNSNDFIADFIVRSITSTFVYNHPPQLIAEVLGSNEGGWDLANVVWQTSHINIGSTPTYSMTEIQIYIDGVLYLGNANVTLNKVGETPVNLGTKSLALPPTISGTAPWPVTYNETVYLYFKQP